MVLTQTLATKANQTLLTSSNPELRRLDVRETDDNIEITGSVSCFYLKQLAQESLRSAARGRRILNRVEVLKAD